MLALPQIKSLYLPLQFVYTLENVWNHVFVAQTWLGFRVWGQPVEPHTGQDPIEKAILVLLHVGAPSKPKVWIRA